MASLITNINLDWDIFLMISKSVLSRLHCRITHVCIIKIRFYNEFLTISSYNHSWHLLHEWVQTLLVYPIINWISQSTIIVLTKINYNYFSYHFDIYLLVVDLIHFLLVLNLWVDYIITQIFDYISFLARSLIHLRFIPNTLIRGNSLLFTCDHFKWRIM